MTHFTVEFQTTGQAAYGRLLSKHQLASTWTVMPSQPHSVAQQAIGVRGPPSRFKPGAKPRARTPVGSKGPGAHLVTHVPTAEFTLEEMSVSSLVASSAGPGTPTASPMPHGTLSPSGDVANWCGDHAGSPQPPPAAAQPPAVLSPALEEEEPAEPQSFVDHPAARSPVALPPAEAKLRTRRGLKPRVRHPPRIIPEAKPLYYLHGVTGYDCVQHRSSTGMNGSRPFSLRASDAFDAQKGVRDDPSLGPRFAHQDTFTGSPAPGNIIMGRRSPPGQALLQVSTRMLCCERSARTKRQADRPRWVSRTQASTGAVCVASFQSVRRPGVLGSPQPLIGPAGAGR